MLREPLVEDNLDWVVIYFMTDEYNTVVSKKYIIHRNCKKENIPIDSDWKHQIIELNKFNSNNFHQHLKISTEDL